MELSWTSQKNIAPERHKVTKYCKKQQLRAKMNSSAEPVDPADPADLPETVSSTAARTFRSTRAGSKDDGSLNKLT